MFLEAPKARELLGGRRTRILEILQLVLDSGRSGESATATPALIDELLVEGAISVIRARVASPQQGALSRLLDELMGVITYSYIGPPSTIMAPPTLTPGRRRNLARAALARAWPVRMTYRTLRVLTALAENPGASNRQVADAAGREQRRPDLQAPAAPVRPGACPQRGLHRNGAPKRWHLTDRGQALQRRGQRDLDRHGLDSSGVAVEEP